MVDESFQTSQHFFCRDRSGFFRVFTVFNVNLMLGENRSCPKSLMSRHTNNSDKLSECFAAIQLTAGNQHNLPNKKIFH